MNRFSAHRWAFLGACLPLLAAGCPGEGESSAGDEEQLAQVSQAVSAAVVQNGDFETGDVAGFRVRGAMMGTTLSPHGGTETVRLRGAAGFVAQDVTSQLSPGVFYELSAWVRQTGPLTDTVNTPRLRVGTDCETFAGEYVGSSVPPPFDNFWQPLFAQYTFSQAELDGTVCVGVTNDGHAGDVFIDDITITAGGDDVPLANPGFESGTLGGWRVPKVRAVSGPGLSHGGTYALEVGGGGVPFVSQNVQARLVPGVAYTFAVAVKVTHVGQYPPRLRVGKSCELGLDYAEVKAVNQTNPAGSQDGWQTLTWTSDAAGVDTTQPVCVGVIDVSGTGNPAVFLVDDLRVTTPELCSTPWDDDGDGVVNNGCICEPGATTACQDGLDACHEGQKTCNADGKSYGPCVDPVALSGTPCEDGDLCTADTCQNGICTPGSPLVCPADPCHEAGTCDPATGTCSFPPGIPECTSAAGFTAFGTPGSTVIIEEAPAPLPVPDGARADDGAGGPPTPTAQVTVSDPSGVDVQVDVTRLGLDPDKPENVYVLYQANGAGPTIAIPISPEQVLGSSLQLRALLHVPGDLLATTFHGRAVVFSGFGPPPQHPIPAANTYNCNGARVSAHGNALCQALSLYSSGWHVSDDNHIFDRGTAPPNPFIGDVVDLMEGGFLQVPNRRTWGVDPPYGPEETLAVPHRIRDMIARTVSHFTLTQLATPKSQLLEAVKEGLALLNMREGKRRNFVVPDPDTDPMVTVRILSGLDDSIAAFLGPLVPPEPLYIRVQAASQEPYSSYLLDGGFNHTKIASRDGVEAIAMGYETLVSYHQNGDADLALHLTGTEAAWADRIAIALWDHVACEATTLEERGSIPPVADSGYCNQFTALAHPEPPAAPGGTTTVFSVFSGGSADLAVPPTYGFVPALPFGGTSSEPPSLFHPGAAPGTTLWSGPPPIYETQASDEALMALIRSATSTVYIAQEMLSYFEDPELVNYYANNIFSEDLYRAIGEALLDGVDVYITVDAGAGSNYPFSSLWAPDSLRKHLTEQLTSYQYGGDRLPLDVVCSHLHVIPYNRASNSPYTHTHQKFVMVDRKIFYVGSQNLYPGSLYYNQCAGNGESTGNYPGCAAVVGAPLAGALYEFGFIVDDEAIAERVAEELWDQNWMWSLAGASESDLVAPQCDEAGELGPAGELAAQGCQDFDLVQSLAAEVIITEGTHVPGIGLVGAPPLYKAGMLNTQSSMSLAVVLPAEKAIQSIDLFFNQRVLEGTLNLDSDGDVDGVQYQGDERWYPTGNLETVITIDGMDFPADDSIHNPFLYREFTPPVESQIFSITLADQPWDNLALQRIRVCGSLCLQSCAPAGPCQGAGTCDPATGVCTYPNAPNGTSCSDGNPCTTGDSCQSGVCTGGSPVTCGAPSQCKTGGTCNPATGACTYSNKANGTPCSDGSLCTTGDSCQSGVCAGGSPVTCAAPSQCQTGGTCNPATGACTYSNKSNGSPCNDGDACTIGDSCQSGQCVASGPGGCNEAHWKLDDGSGAIALDSSGSGNHGSLVGGPGWTGGPMAGALGFDGADDWVDIPTLSFPGDFTIVFWAKLDGEISNKDCVVGQAGPGQDINFYQGKLRLYAPGDVIIAATAATAGVWTKYAIVRAGSSLWLYINGAQSATGSWSGVFSPSAIGRGNAGFLGGTIDDLRIYPYALSAAEL